jgi:hypothetical protein
VTTIVDMNVNQQKIFTVVLINHSSLAIFYLTTILDMNVNEQKIRPYSFLF